MGWGGAGSHKTGKTQAETIRGMMKTGRESTDGLVSNRDYQHKPGRWRQKYSQTLDTLQTQEATTIKSKQEPKLRKTDPIWGCILVSQFPSSSSWCDEHSLESWMSAKSSQTHTQPCTKRAVKAAQFGWTDCAFQPFWDNTDNPTRIQIKV